jgi:hypothetical protein
MRLTLSAVSAVARDRMTLERQSGADGAPALEPVLMGVAGQAVFRTRRAARVQIRVRNDADGCAAAAAPHAARDASLRQFKLDGLRSRARPSFVDV